MRDAFAVLDDLIQYSYVASDRFVILSRVEGNSWRVWAGLVPWKLYSTANKENESGWWAVSWEKKDVMRILVSSVKTVLQYLHSMIYSLQGSNITEPSFKELEELADKLADAIVNGHISVKDWNRFRPHDDLNVCRLCLAYSD